MDMISAARLQAVYPPLAAKIGQMVTMLEPEGIEVRVLYGLRSWQQQQALYEQGRDPKLIAKGPHGDVIDAAKVVTNCPGGHSWHNFGLAVDCCPSRFAPDQPFNPDWNAAHPAWKRMEQAGISLGMVSGSTWRTFPDAPHFQINGRFPEGAPDDEARQLFKDGGMQAVWKELGPL
jgi:peptidoglycan L-alanyl-D-glutamate endopeptidase CwlK